MDYPIFLCAKLELVIWNKEGKSFKVPFILLQKKESYVKVPSFYKE